LPVLVKPTRIVRHVQEIDLADLWTMGIRGFIFDLDNTIMAPRSAMLDEVVTEWLKTVYTMGFRSVVVSNNPMTTYTREAEKLLNMPVIGNAGKPRRKHLRRALVLLEMEAHQVAVVGDRPLTDIWGGQRLGAATILVSPLTGHQENPVVQCLRRLERLFIHPDAL
jgi:HAD superfamily phosphatase (TIGR01668 family)